MLAALLTDIEGAGHGFERGFVTYTKEAKTELLGIGPTLLDHNDAVSEVVARHGGRGAQALPSRHRAWRDRLRWPGRDRIRRKAWSISPSRAAAAHRAPRRAFRGARPWRCSG